MGLVNRDIVKIRDFGEYADSTRIKNIGKLTDNLKYRQFNR